MIPSTSKQKDLSKLLVQQLKEIGYEAFLDDKGYVYSKINKNVDYDVTPIGFVAHVDTSFDAPGANVKPRIITNYDGSDIKLNEYITMNPNKPKRDARLEPEPPFEEESDEYEYDEDYDEDYDDEDYAYEYEDDFDEDFVDYEDDEDDR